MAKCLKCGTQLDEGTKFCYKCGEPAPKFEAPVVSPASAEDDYTAALRRAEARAAGESEPVQSAPAAEDTAREVKSESGYTAYTSPAKGGSSYSGKSSFVDDGNVSTWQRAKNLASAMSESGKGRKKAGRAIAIAALVLLAALCLIVMLQPQKGYDSHTALIEAYVGDVTSGNTSSLTEYYLPELVEYYETAYRRSDIPYVVDIGMSDGIYPYVESWWIQDTLSWEADFYAEEFDKLGADVRSGLDVQVYFTVRAEGGDLTDYYVFELVDTANGWFLLTVFYED